MRKYGIVALAIAMSFSILATSSFADDSVNDMDSKIDAINTEKEIRSVETVNATGLENVAGADMESRDASSSENNQANNIGNGVVNQKPDTLPINGKYLDPDAPIPQIIKTGKTNVFEAIFDQDGIWYEDFESGGGIPIPEINPDPGWRKIAWRKDSTSGINFIGVYDPYPIMPFKTINKEIEKRIQDGNKEARNKFNQSFSKLTHESGSEGVLDDDTTVAYKDYYIYTKKPLIDYNQILRNNVYGYRFTSPKVNPIEGYEFVGWKLFDEKGSELDMSANISGNVKAIAQYKKINIDSKPEDSKGESEIGKEIPDYIYIPVEIEEEKPEIEIEEDNGKVIGETIDEIKKSEPEEKKLDEPNETLKEETQITCKEVKIAKNARCFRGNPKTGIESILTIFNVLTFSLSGLIINKKK